MSKPTVSFNSSDLATVVPGLRILGTDPYRYPQRNLANLVLANSDKSVTSSAYFESKKINIQAEIGQDTRELLDAAIDTLYQYLAGIEKALVISSGSGTRSWTATLENISITDALGGHAVVEIQFLCADPFGRDVNSTSLFSTALTGSSSETSFVTSGSAPFQQPIITITLSALTGGTSKVVTIGNHDNGQALSISRSWTAGDVIVIDCQAKTVKVNGTEVAFTGAIPEWARGAGIMDYSDTLTTRTRTMSAVYYKRYI